MAAKVDPHDVLSDEFMAAAAIAALHPSTAEDFAKRVRENLRRYPNLRPEKRAALEECAAWLEMVARN